MQDKLFFTGIPEERLEDTEAVLQIFFSQKRYKLGYNIPFERVQRMGIWSKWKEQSVTPLQKFHTIKTENLYDKNEQFSTEIKEKRRLYPILRQAKTDHKGASLITETLYIQGEKCDLLTGSAPRFYPDRTVSHYSTPAQSQQSGTTKHHQPINRQRQGSTPDRF